MHFRPQFRRLCFPPSAVPTVALCLGLSLFSAAGAPPRFATAAAAKAGLTQVFQDDFQRPDGTNLGPGWSATQHYGVVNKQIVQHRLRFDIPNGHDIPWGSATLDLDDHAVLGHGLRVGDYFEVTLHRLGSAGSLGVELFDSDQLRVGSDITAGASPLLAWNGTTWVPISSGPGQPVAFDWNTPHTLGVRFDSADGHHTAFSYYLDGQYAGSWLINTPNTALGKIGVFAQTKTGGAAFEFSDLKVFAHLLIDSPALPGSP
jgi:hypothetical protein